MTAPTLMTATEMRAHLKGWGEPFQTVEGATRALREAGWTVGKRVLCPVCIAAVKTARVAGVKVEL